MSYTLKAKSKEFHLNIRDGFGEPSTVHGPPVWSVPDSELVTVAQAVDGLTAVVTRTGPSGEVTLSVIADADLGPAVRSIMGQLLLILPSLEAETIEIEPTE